LILKILHKLNDKHVFHSIQIETETESKATSTDTIALINTSLEKDIKNTDQCTEYKSQSIDMSSEYCKDSVVAEVSFEKVKDTVDFGGSVETNVIEVGTETFGEKVKIYVDTLTSHEAKADVEVALTEFSCEMIDSESCLERKYIEQGCSYTGSKVVEVSSELFTSTFVDCSTEYTMNISESLVDQCITTCDVAVETIAIVVVDESSSVELSYCTVECERSEEIDEVIPLTAEAEESQLPRLEDESIASSDVKVVDIGTTVKATLVDISSQMEIEHVEHSSEWSKVSKHDSEIFETEKTACLSTLATSDNVVQYCTIDIQFEHAKSKTVEYGYETKCRIVEAQSDYEVNFRLFFINLSDSCIHI
jgi:hypothetical protein